MKYVGLCIGSVNVIFMEFYMHFLIFLNEMLGVHAEIKGLVFITELDFFFFQRSQSLFPTITVRRWRRQRQSHSIYIHYTYICR